MNEILVSTITPCFRMKKYLKRFLDDLPKQTMFEKIEVVLDHNEPDEEEISWVREFQSKYPGRLKHIIIEKVDPIAISMNRCIRESVGEFLAIWNVDDLRTNSSIEDQYKKIIKDEKNGVVYGDFNIVKSFGSFNGRLIDCSSYNEFDFLRSMVFGPFFMFRKELVSKIGFFDEQLKSGADFDFSVRLAIASRPVYVNKNLGFYLNEGLGASTRPNSLQELERTVIELRYGIFDKIDYNFVALASHYNIRNFLFDGDFLPVNNYISEYNDLINKNKSLIEVGIKKFILKEILMIEKIKKVLKKIIKSKWLRKF